MNFACEGEECDDEDVAMKVVMKVRANDTMIAADSETSLSLFRQL